MTDQQRTVALCLAMARENLERLLGHEDCLLARAACAENIEANLQAIERLNLVA